MGRGWGKKGEEEGRYIVRNDVHFVLYQLCAGAPSAGPFAPEVGTLYWTWGMKMAASRQEMVYACMNHLW